ncbi:hypothetical protein HIM_02795 [Hirsutella minnesotensis 3608]|nr:hypothetical protein HIM_02795 [Hirsutella minnesotensis 3608]
MFSLPIRPLRPGWTAAARALPATASISLLFRQSFPSTSPIITAARHYSDLQQQPQGKDFSHAEPAPPATQGSKVSGQKPDGADRKPKYVLPRMRRVKKEAQIAKANDDKAIRKQRAADRRAMMAKPISPPQLSAEEIAQQPWFVRRTPYMQFPVYKVIKSGGTRILTVIKKIEGNQQKFSQEVKKLCDLDWDRMRRKLEISQLQLKGDHRDKIVQWLLKRGF